MTRSLFRYIWQHSRRDQIIIFAVVLVSLPFYYVSLDLPRKIVNEAIQGRAFENGQMTAPFMDINLSWPKWLGGGSSQLFAGFEVGRLQLLYGLSLLFLFFVLVNGFIKFWINVEKGALGERMMRRLRFELFAGSLRFTPDALRNVRSAEAATIIKDEVEPIGGFIGDAFIQPVLLGTQAITALLFILIQSMWLGILAGGVVGIQFVVIPRMRRELLRLGRQRQIASRRFAGRIGEVVDGMEAVQVHNTGAWERAEIGGRLHELFDIRFKIYKRKFVVKFLNNILAQMTPFFFYAVGGYFALTGKLDIGQLVAVIAAYRELPPPLKELIDWDQQRLDVQVKYDQVVGYFSPEKLKPEGEEEEEHEPCTEPLAGELRIADLQVLDGQGRPVITHGDATLDLPATIALVSDGSSAASALARILASRTEGHTGKITVGGHDLLGLGAEETGRRVAYAGTEPILFPGTIRNNLLYGLRQRQLREPDATAEEARRRLEAQRTGNPVDTVTADWVDLERSGYPDAGALDEAMVDLLKRIGLGEDVYRFGLSGVIDPERQPVLAERIVEARERLRAHLAEHEMSDLIEPFDPERYNTQATIAENLLFGVPISKALIGRAIAEHEGFKAVLDKTKLTDEFVRMGLGIAETMTEIFADVPAGHPLFDQFSFMHADELGEFAAIVKRSRVKGRGGMTRMDRRRLLALPFGYIEPRHRLGLLDDDMRGRLLEARALVREAIGREEDPEVEFYNPEKVTVAAPVRDNLLFGRVNETIADARERVRDAGAEIIKEMDLAAEIERVGLDHEVGPAGRLLTPAQRASVNLVRCLVKRPDLLVVDGALAPFGENRVGPTIAFLKGATQGRTLAMVLSNDRHVDLFDHTIRFEGDRLVVDGSEAAVPEPTSSATDEPPTPERQRGSPDDGFRRSKAANQDDAVDTKAPDEASAERETFPPRAAAE